MREILRRLERLEQIAPKMITPPSIRIQLIDVAEGGGPAPWNPAWASPHGASEQRIEREAAETVEAFEARASQRFPAGIYMMGA